MMDCPTAAEGTISLKKDDNGYCLSYPEGNAVVVPLEGVVSLVPGEPPYMACNSASLVINVEEAEGERQIKWPTRWR